VAGIEVALLAATNLEAEPLLTRFAEVRRETVAGKSWYRAVLDAPDVRREVLLIVSGYDKTNTAHALTCLLQAAPCLRLVLQFGVAGAFAGQGLGLRDLVVAGSEIYGDTGSSSPGGWLSTEDFGLPLAEVGGQLYWNEFPLEPRLVAAALHLLEEAAWDGRPPVIASGPCVTLSQVTGTAGEAALLQERWRALAESMEGAAAAHVCVLYRVPFLEVRSVSNQVGDRDRAGWDLQGASVQAARAAAVLVLGWPDLVAALGLGEPGWAPPGSGE
jgi:futalosine hydrolase